MTGSLGILSEALHSGLDLIAAVITYFSVRISDKPADKEHNYGHGKIGNFSALLDKAPSETIDKIERMLKGYGEIMFFHNLKVRASGADTFVEFNIHLSPEYSLKDVHELCDRIEDDIKSNIPRCEVYIHAEPDENNHASPVAETGVI